MNSKKELLKDNRKALQFLHHAKAFDFQRDHVIIRGEGRFTFNSVSKAIAAEIQGFYTAAILIRPSGAGWRGQKLYYASVENGRFDATRFQGLPYSKCEIDYCWGVGVFEELRKSDTDHYYIIAQRTEYANPRKPEGGLDLSQRYRYISGHDRRCGDGNGNSWINGFRVMALDGSARIIDYTTEKRYYGRVQYERSYKAVSDLIDKSGYLLAARREEWRRRADQLRRERAAAQAAETDFFDMEADAAKRIAEYKARISAALYGAATPDDYKAVEKMLYNIGRAVYYFDRHKRFASGKHYACIGDAEREFASIRDYLGKEA